MTTHPSQGDVPFDRFYSWAQSVNGGPLTLAEMARRSGRSRSFYSEARSQGSIDGASVAGYARAVGMSPLGALAESLDADELRSVLEPSQRETLSQVPYNVLLEEVAARFGGPPRTVPIPAGGTTTFRWMEALQANTGMRVSRLAAAVGMAADVFRGKRDRATFSTTELRAITQVTGGSLPVGLVAQGWLTWEEAGLPLSGREELLSTWSNEAVGAWLIESGQELKRALHKV